MGCDIHSVVEFKNGDWWDDLGEISIGRWYSLFANMAGVRNYNNNLVPVAEPRGFPKDASFESKYKYENWGSDAHTPSWLTLDEFRLAYKNSDGYRDPVLDAIISAMETLESNGHNTRIVFWFDN